MRIPHSNVMALALSAVIGWLLLASACRAHTPANYDLLEPQGTGPFPAVIVMHGCDGINANTRRWAERLVGWGYAALIVDSFRARGLTSVCGRGRALPGSVRAQDAIEAKNYLRSLPRIAKDRIGLLGFSHGGWSALEAAGSFRAVVAFYPLCTTAARSNTLVLIGSADDWTPADQCRGRAANLKVYAGATHAFDAPRGERTYLGHRMAYDSGAAADAESRTRQFLAARLGR